MRNYKEEKVWGDFGDQLLGSHDSLSGLKVLENVGMKVQGLGEQPANNPLLPDKKGVSLAGVQVGVPGNFLFIVIITRNSKTQKIPST